MSKKATIPKEVTRNAVDTKPAMDRIRVCRQQVDNRQIRVSKLKSSMKEAKAELEAAYSELLRAIDEFDQPSLFNLEPQNGPVEAWRDVPLETLGLSRKLIETLEEADLTTLGQLADFGKSAQLVEIYGVGESPAEKIQDALDRYWKDHPQDKPSEKKAADNDNWMNEDDGDEDDGE